MKALVPACIAIAILLSACLSSGPPANQPYRLTKANISVGGGTCAGNLCTDGNGALWDCSGGSACFRIETSGK